MPAGRPFNSITPPWRSTPAVMVVTYRFLMTYKRQEATKSGCARYCGISRNTVIKWWDLIEWTPQEMRNLSLVYYQWDDKKTEEENIKRLSYSIVTDTEHIRLYIATLDMLYYNKLFNFKRMPSLSKS